MSIFKAAGVEGKKKKIMERVHILIIKLSQLPAPARVPRIRELQSDGPSETERGEGGRAATFKL